LKFRLTRQSGKSAQLRYAATLLAPMWWARAYVLGVPLLVAVATGVGTQFVTPRYTAMARLLPPQTNLSTAPLMANRIGGNPGLGLSAMVSKNPSDLYAQLFVSRSVQDHAVKVLDLNTYYGTTDPEQARRRLYNHTSVRVDKTGLIELMVIDNNAQRSADIANALIAGMYQVGQRLSRDAARHQIEFYDRLIAETRERLRVADDQLMSIETRSGLTRLKGQEEATISTITELQGLLATREVDLAKMLRSATEYHPAVQRMRAEVNALRGQVALIERPKASKRTDILLPPSAYPELRREVEPARREVESLTAVLQDLQKTREASRIDEARDLSTLVVLDPAVVPSQRSWPVTTRMMFNAAAGALVLALGTAFFCALRAARRQAAGTTR